MRLNLRRMRLDRGETQAAVAAATGLPPTTISAWERHGLAGAQSPRLAGLAALLAHYGLTLAVVPASPGTTDDADR